MIKKYSVLFLVLALFVQHNVAKKRPPNLRVLQAKVATGTKNIKHHAKDKSEEGNDSANLLKRQLEDIEIEGLGEAEEIINDLKSSAESELRNGVIDAGGDIDKIPSCTKEYETELEEFWKAAAKNVTGCVTERIEQGIQIIKNIVDASKTIADIGIRLPNRIDTNCPLVSNSSPKKILQAHCALKQISKASAELLSQGTIIAKNVLEGYILVHKNMNKRKNTRDTYICLVKRALRSTVNFVPVLVPIVQCTLK